MRTRYLHYFLAVAQEQSFTRASASVHIEPSPLSRAIKELESQLNVRLFHRAKGRIRLTQAGEAFREEAYRILNLVTDAKHRVLAADFGYTSRLRLAISDSLAQPQLAQLLARCREEEPSTRIHIMEMTVSSMIRALDDDQIDAGLTVHAESGQDHCRETLWIDLMAVATPRNHPLLSFERIPIQEITKYPLIVSHPELCAGGYSSIQRWLPQPSIPPHTIAEHVSGHEPMMLLVAAGYGIGLGLESQLGLFRHPDVIIRPTTSEIPSIRTFIVTGDPRSPALERFVERAHRIGGIGELTSP